MIHSIDKLIRIVPKHPILLTVKLERWQYNPIDDIFLERRKQLKMLFGLQNEADIFVQFDDHLFLGIGQILYIVGAVCDDLGERVHEYFDISGSIGNQCTTTTTIIIAIIIGVSISIDSRVVALHWQQNTAAFVQQFDDTILNTAV